MTPGQKALYQRIRETRINNAKRRAQAQEPHFTRFLTRRTKYKINTLKWERDSLLREIDTHRDELVDAYDQGRLDEIHAQATGEYRPNPYQVAKDA